MHAFVVAFLCNRELYENYCEFKDLGLIRLSIKIVCTGWTGTKSACWAQSWSNSWPKLVSWRGSTRKVVEWVPCQGIHNSPVSRWCNLYSCRRPTSGLLWFICNYVVHARNNNNHGSTLVLARCKANIEFIGKIKLCTTTECSPFNSLQPKFEEVIT